MTISTLDVARENVKIYNNNRTVDAITEFSTNVVELGRPDTALGSNSSLNNNPPFLVVMPSLTIQITRLY